LIFRPNSIAIFVCLYLLMHVSYIYMYIWAIHMVKLNYTKSSYHCWRMFFWCWDKQAWSGKPTSRKYYLSVFIGMNWRLWTFNKNFNWLRLNEMAPWQNYESLYVSPGISHYVAHVDLHNTSSGPNYNDKLL